MVSSLSTLRCLPCCISEHEAVQLCTNDTSLMTAVAFSTVTSSSRVYSGQRVSLVAMKRTLRDYPNCELQNVMYMCMIVLCCAIP